MNKFKLVIVIALFSIITNNSKAQTIKVIDTEISFENKLRPALSANTDPEQDALESAWKSYMKKNFDIKFKSSSFSSNENLLAANDITVIKISDKRLNLKARISGTANGSEIKVFASFGYDIFINKNDYPKEHEALKSIITNFLLEFLTDFYNREIKETTKKIHKLNNKKISLLKSIEKNNKKITKSEAKLSKLNSVQDSSGVKEVKTLKKINKLTSKNATRENSNRESNGAIIQIDEKLIVRKEQLESLKAKYDNLRQYPIKCVKLISESAFFIA